VIRTRTKAIEARRENLHWRVTLLDLRKKVMKMVIARALVNGAGPWAGTVLSNIHGRDESHKLRLVKGSHIIVPSFYEGAHCYVLQNDDRRIIFVMPYETDFCLIGTTEVPFEGDPATAETSTGETAYLCDVVSRYFRKPLYPRDVIKSFAGVRPLAEDGAASASAASRDYALMLDAPKGQAPLLSVLGGKITTYRRLAEDALTHLAPTLGPFGESWTATTALPGSDITAGDYESFLKLFKAQHPWLSPTLAGRLTGAYGTRAAIILKGAKSEKDLGHAFGADLFQAEVDYLIEQEFAQTAEDILWRRTKLALCLSQQEVEALSVYVERRTA
ncbi:MAG: glycerol-3-phosphate dehydrogenase, partial [Alphaproteobacteria bacterium]|nr:glycerol-3-phosphate dehydrogenase [Alphaproteobacteria bacterium]